MMTALRPVLCIAALAPLIVASPASTAIRAFGEEDTPVSLGIVLDVSKSMGSWLDDAKKALREFLRASNPEDEAFLFTV